MNHMGEYLNWDNNKRMGQGRGRFGKVYQSQEGRCFKVPFFELSNTAVYAEVSTFMGRGCLKLFGW